MSSCSDSSLESATIPNKVVRNSRHRTTEYDNIRNTDHKIMTNHLENVNKHIKYRSYGGANSIHIAYIYKTRCYGKPRTCYYGSAEGIGKSLVLNDKEDINWWFKKVDGDDSRYDMFFGRRLGRKGYGYKVTNLSNGYLVTIKWASSDSYSIS